MMLETISPEAQPAEPERAPGRPGTTLLANALEGLEGRFLAQRLGRGQARTILHIARDQPRMAFIARVMRFFAPAVEIVSIPAWDCLPYDRVSPNLGLMAERLAALARLAQGPAQKPRLVLTSANAILQKVPARHDNDVLAMLRGFQVHD